MEVNTKNKKNKHKNTMATTMMKEEEEEDYYYSSTYSSCSCFFCVIKHPNPRVRRSSLSAFFREMPFRESDEDVLVMSSLWSTAMAEPNGTELPSAGALRCMSLLIDKGISNPSWLRRRQNVYIPYYAAHVLGSYTIRSPSLASLAVDAGAVEPLLGLLRGRMTWVEQRVAVRALGHLASYDATFPAVARHAEEVIGLAVFLASNCADTVYQEFAGAKAREKYHRDLLTRGLGGVEVEDRKAEEWASQLQCWSLNLLSCFAWKDEMYHSWMCRDTEFLKKLCKMWGGMAVNGDTHAAAGLMRILCRSDTGREAMADCEEVVDSLCNLSRSSDDSQYMGIDCLLLLVSDPSTRTKVRDAAVPCLLDLAELRSLGSRKRLGKMIVDVLLSNFDDLREELMVERERKEETMSDEEVMKRKSSAAALKREGNEAFFSGSMEEAISRYTEALEECPLRMRKERMVLYSNRAQCRLLLQEPDAAISDATRGLSLSAPANGHGRSLWRRAQAYDMKGMARESLTDCITFVGGRADGKRGKAPYFAARMINKQMSAVGLFAASARAKTVEEKTADAISAFGLPTIEEEPTTPRKEGDNGKEAKRGFHDSTTREGIRRHQSLMYSRR
ncbi:uncharacterized protein M6B38_365295 [Iris pallida]|uniref:Protein unc-45 homolog B n=1 Tax=Iris pallida TaxID=29817 RepID=A0AAX6GGI6_IRIPA|nr:uncharacterized protein M6B38_365295 [Iris pallida]